MAVGMTVPPADKQNWRLRSEDFAGANAECSAIRWAARLREEFRCAPGGVRQIGWSQTRVEGSRPRSAHHAIRSAALARASASDTSLAKDRNRSRAGAISLPILAS